MTTEDKNLVKAIEDYRLGNITFFDLWRFIKKAGLAYQ
jgi:hypothetical protein